jgi:hypothetical protein
MGVFFVPGQPVVPEVRSALKIALLVNPALISNVDQEAAHRTTEVMRATSPQFSPLRFLVALVIAGGLLYGGILAARHNLPDISRDLMFSFAGFGGIVIGLLSAEGKNFSA